MPKAYPLRRKAHRKPKAWAFAALSLSLSLIWLCRPYDNFKRVEGCSIEGSSASIGRHATGEGSRVLTSPSLSTTIASQLTISASPVDLPHNNFSNTIYRAVQSPISPPFHDTGHLSRPAPPYGLPVFPNTHHRLLIKHTCGVCTTLPAELPSRNSPKLSKSSTAGRYDVWKARRPERAL